MPMKKLRNIFLILSLIFFASHVCYQTKAAAQQKTVLRISDQKTINYAEIFDDLRQAQIVYIGESHDNQAHHQLQLDIVKALHDSGKPLSVGFEMFTEKSQGVLDAWVSGNISQDEFVRAYYDNWNFPWPLYRDILLYIKENKIPAIGLNVEPAITRKVAQSGFASLTKEELEKLPPDVGCAVDKQYMEFIRRVYARHGHGDKGFLFFCQAQLLWDQVMARNIIGFLQKNPERTIIVITGNGHAWKRGIPAQVRLLSAKIRYRVILPYIPGYIESRFISINDADYLLSP
jgi:uncharacterized iron-regulated protein